VIQSQDPFFFVDRQAAWQRKEEDRRARYRGFTDADHFLTLASQRGPTAAVAREYRIIFMGGSLDNLPFPVIADVA
jgi:hypothetical protein